MAENLITCEVNTPNEQTSYALSIDDAGELAIHIRSNGSTINMHLEPEAGAILAAFLKHPAVAERLPSSDMHALELNAPQLGTSMRAPRQLFADLYPKEEK